ncbi:RNA polymerase sigma factor [Lysinibacillus sp. NPDC093190]
MQSEFLVKKAKKGDGEAFIQLIRQYEMTLYRTAKRLGLKDEDIADLLQDTILTAFEKIDSLKEAK